jgi:glutamate-1-semialdehyde 2,1-aminomutase
MRSDELFEQAKAVLPGGVCASVRLNQGLGKPVYVTEARGAHFTDVDGREYIDMCCSHGAALLGHGHPAVLEAIGRASGLGICCSFDTPHHVALAETICRLVPCAERVRFTNSGTEATLHALRLCRAFTGRDKIIRFVGHFHGYHEITYIGGHPPASALDDAARFVESVGIPAALSEYIIAVPFNDLDAAEEAIRTHRHEAGTVILEPINYNSGCILPQPGYLEGLRRLTEEHDLLLFFDEIQSGFRKSPGGAQQDFGVVPDICTIGKALGGGLPLSAICGRAEIMDRFKPAGDVQHSGTFNAPLVSILAGLAFCQEIAKPRFYPELLAQCDRFYQALDEVIERVGVPVVAPHHGARFGLLMGLNRAPISYRDTLAHRKDIMLAFVRETAERGVYFHDYGGSACHHGFSAAHTEEDLDRVLEVVEEALAALREIFGSPTA